MKTYCNPLDLPYRYQHVKSDRGAAGFREGADPTLVFFKDRYYLFVSMSAGFFHSEDLLHWQYHQSLELPIYDYAPDVRAVGNYLYFCASSRSKNCPIMRTADPLQDAFEEVAAPFPFWDPDLFLDDDGRLYFYWGCTNIEPIWGVELDPDTLTPIGEKKGLIFDQSHRVGYERAGENGVVNKNDSAMYRALSQYFDAETNTLHLPEDFVQKRGFTVEHATKTFMAIGKPYIEGAFMTKYQGKYYLQYAAPGTQFNIYADGVYVGDSPMGPFTLQKSNPFSAVPGGFITGAGHGSTIQDRHGNYWHASTMRISRNHDYERRVGLFPAGFDEDDTLYCNQNFACFPHRVPQERFDPRTLEPEYMLLSYRKDTFASSTAPGSSTANSVDEDCRTWWSAADSASGQWLAVDLGTEMDVHAIQVNMADEALLVDFPPESYLDDRRSRHIDTQTQISTYVIESSIDGTTWQVQGHVEKECCNGFFELSQGIAARYVRVVGEFLPYDQPMRISGLRVFGFGRGAKPDPVRNAAAQRCAPMDAIVRWDAGDGAQGCNVRYGIAPDKLYMSWLVYDASEVRLCTLTADQEYYIAVDSFNENGITYGEAFRLK